MSNSPESKHTEPPVLTIATGSRNRPDYLEKFLDSVIQHTTCTFEIIIGDASESPLEYDDTRVRIIHENPPIGPVRGFNKLMNYATGEYVCYLNDDLEVLPGWSDAVLKVFESNPELDMACVPLMEPDDPDPFVLLYKQIPYAQMGVVRRTVGDSLGWLDERFKNYAPDADFTMRMIDAGKKIAPILGKIVWHHKIDDENRIVMENNAKSDNSELGRIWKPRRFDIRKKFEQNSYRYFSNLGIRFSDTYGCDMLDIPSDPKTENRAPDRPYEITYPRFYRVTETIYRIESFLRSIGKK